MVKLSPKNRSASLKRLFWKHLAGLAIALPILSYGAAAIAQVYQLGDTGSEVESIQRALGISPDGVYGSDTESAVLNFQESRGLRCVDGVAGPETLSALGLDYLSDNSQPCYGSAQQGGYDTSGGGICGTAIAPYVVVVPGGDRDKLYDVRRLAPYACQADSHLGSYIRASSFNQRGSAETLSRQLRQAGFDARVAYRRLI